MMGGGFYPDGDDEERWWWWFEQPVIGKKIGGRSGGGCGWSLRRWCLSVEGANGGGQSLLLLQKRLVTHTKRLDWNTRMNIIAAGAERGLEYLHDN
ncbi:hypothetical protein HanXRQr2_Chr17g0818921 [Helianthus annuus]|uniref:Uncharacterized protein n=1 Tax=Helianthus annuus TaxID=4232 RepID=A0A251VHC2_HELAN|nr:hypothetical protein HanXRQr2_Chr17g0818921 [Helianthus annuus]KAJ0633545.1 hypothetical protein HanLR1_Chr17g0678081 [Helianthus annuus]KAJ0637358.1 hypothetical protein HanOQP8_Chr17g0672871 [Helianthus annuus]KAJ0814686.1 hypothetical protein HanPSC8_Chr17g0788731 [Helianthus annuus]